MQIIVQIVHAIPYELFVPAMGVIEINIQDLVRLVEAALIEQVDARVCSVTFQVIVMSYVQCLFFVSTRLFQPSFIRPIQFGIRETDVTSQLVLVRELVFPVDVSVRTPGKPRYFAFLPCRGGTFFQETFRFILLPVTLVSKARRAIQGQSVLWYIKFKLPRSFI